jgi:DNA-binding HxlR family transcriptional regulator
MGYTVETSMTPIATESGAILPNPPFMTCPIRETMDVLGRKWALLVISHIGVRHISRFNQLVKENPGMTPRALSLLLHDLHREGFLLRYEDHSSTRPVVRYSLTRKGRDVLPVIAALMEFGMTHFADRVFEDGKARDLSEVFPGSLEIVFGSTGRAATRSVTPTARAGRKSPLLTQASARRVASSTT